MEANLRNVQFGGDWKEVYKAALFEDDNGKIPQRIDEAESALATRALELAEVGRDEIREQQALENARYFLRILRNIAGATSVPKEYCRPRRFSQTNSLKRGKHFVIPDASQDLHTMASPAPACNE
jgi:hypothetical protein